MKPKLTNQSEIHETQPETIGFTVIEERKLAVINGNMCLENREEKANFHFKNCYYAAILCIIAKVIKDVDQFSSTILDQFIFLANKISEQIGRLRYKSSRWFNNIEIFDVKCNVLLKQIQYADPENWQEDNLTQKLSSFLEKDQSVTLVFENASYAIWRENDTFFFFDPYSCERDGRVGDGFACLMKFCNLLTMINRIRENTGETADKEYRLYSLSITHIEPKKEKKKCKTKRRNNCNENDILEKTHDATDENSLTSESSDESEEMEIELEAKYSLNEIKDWVINEKRKISPFDMKQQGFTALRNYNASVFEVTVVENKITRPELPPFKRQKKKMESNDSLDDKMERTKAYDRRFKEHCYLLEPIDLCVMGWAYIHDPITWGVNTVKGLYEASRDYAFDSLLASEDTTVTEMTDGLLMEFNVANYAFRVVFAPLHKGIALFPNSQ